MISPSRFNNNGELFLLILILIVSPEIKKTEFYQGCLISFSLTIISSSMNTIFCFWTIYYYQVNESLPFSISANPIDLPELLTVFSLRKLDNNLIIFYWYDGRIQYDQEQYCNWVWRKGSILSFPILSH